MVCRRAQVWNAPEAETDLAAVAGHGSCSRNRRRHFYPPAERLHVPANDQLPPGRLPDPEKKLPSMPQPPDGEGYLKTQLSMESYRSLMQGTLYGPVIVPGDSMKSILNRLIEGRADASLRMPHHRSEPLTAQEIRLLRLWINQGARDN